MFDVLTYQKGASLLRMLQQFLGEERFRRGVNNYLNQHSYANTETSDLWDSIEAVTSADGGNEPVRELMDSWIWQPGFPLISASLSGATLTLRQQRFSFDPEAVDATVYIVPINVRVDGVSRTVLLDTDETTLDIGTTTATVLVNANGSGFFRVAYDDALRSRLNAQALAQLSTLERYSLVDDANAAFVAGRLSAQALLALLESFADEQDLAVWQAVGIGLRRLDRIVEDSAADSFRAHVRAVVAPQLGRLGWAATEDEDDLRTKLRALLITLSAVLGNDTDAQQRCRTLLVGADANSDPELVAAATVVTATFGDERDYNRLLDGYYNAPTPQEQLRNLYALAEFSSAELIQRTCEFALSAEVRAQNAPYVLGRCIANRNHGLLAWKIVRQNWDYANSTFPNSSIVRMVDGLKLLNTDEAVADVGAFFSEHEVPQATNTLTQILERQRVNAAVRNREAALFSATLWPGRAGG